MIRLRLTAVAFIATLLLATTSGQAAELTGHWVGVADLPEHSSYFRLIFDSPPAGADAVCEVEELNARAAVKVQEAADGFEFVVRSNAKSVLFSLSATGDKNVMRGTIHPNGGARSFPMLLVRVAIDGHLNVEQFVGQYAMNSGDSYTIRLTRALGRDRLQATNNKTGSTVQLLPTDAGRFVALDAAADFGSPEIEIALEIRAGSPSLEIQVGGRTVDGGKRVEVEGSKLALSAEERLPFAPAGSFSYKQRDVVIDVGDVKLAGTLYIPANAKRRARGAVIVHGSSPGPRSAAWYWTSTLLRTGVVVLAYDKRGCGDSEGIFTGFRVEESADLFDRLASDAAACHAWLCEQSEVDADRVGFAGGSQAGWIMPLAATRSTRDVAFIVSGNGPAVSAGEEQLYSDLTERGVPTDVANKRLAEELSEFESRRSRGYDPRETLENCQVPTLWILGLADKSVPNLANLKSLRELRQKGLRNNHIYLMPDANHNFWSSDSQSGGLLENVISQWLQHLDNSG